MATSRWRRNAGGSSWLRTQHTARQQTKRKWTFERLDERCLLAAVPLHGGFDAPIWPEAVANSALAAALPGQIALTDASDLGADAAHNDPAAAPAAAPPPNSISGSVFRDLNGDGVRQAFEPGVPGMKLFLDTNGNGVRDESYQVTYASTIPLTIPNCCSYVYSHINVNSAPLRFSDVDVTLTIWHDWAANVEIDLLSPAAGSTHLFSDVGGSGNDFLGTVLDDDASNWITLGSAPFYGRYRPEGDLSRIEGSNPNGTWTLQVYDDNDDPFSADAGSLRSWSLTFTFEEPAVTTDSLGNYRIDDLPAGTHRIALDPIPLTWNRTNGHPGYLNQDLPSGGYLENVNFGIHPADVPFLAADGSEPSSNAPESAIQSACAPSCEGAWTEGGLSIHAPGDVDWFRIDTTRDSNWAHVVDLHDYDPRLGELGLEVYGAEVLANPAAPTLRATESFEWGKRVSLDGLPAGTYYAKVSGRGGAVNPQYSLSVNYTGRDWLDYNSANDSRETATDLGAPAGWNRYSWLSIAPRDDDPYTSEDDWYTFETLAGGGESHFVRASFTGYEGDLDMELYYRGGTPNPCAGQAADSEGYELVSISEGVTDEEYISLAGCAAGKYYVRVYGFAGAANPYYDLDLYVPFGETRDWLDEPLGNDSLADATDLGIVEGQLTLSDLSLHAPADQDWFRFETTDYAFAVAGYSVRLDYDATQGDLFLELYDAAGEGILGAGTVEAGAVEIPFDGLPEGAYYIRVSPLSVAGQTPTNDFYTLSIVVPKKQAPDWAEPNNAAPLELGTISGRWTFRDLSLHYVGDVDRFRFGITQRATADHFVRVDSLNSTQPISLELYDPQGTLIGRSYSERNYEEISLAGLPSDAGDYELRVTGANADYQLTIAGPPEMLADRYDLDPGSANNDFARAVDLQVLEGENVWKGMSLTNGDADYFKFTLTAPAVAGHYVRLDLDNDLGDVDLWLYDAQRRLLPGPNSRSNSQTDREEISLAGLGPQLPDDGPVTYYLMVAPKYVAGASPEYDLTIRAPSPLGLDRWDRDPGSQQPPYSDPRPWSEYDTVDVVDLGVLRTRQAWSDLSIHPTASAERLDEDWYLFNLPHPGREGQFVRIDFLDVLGDLDMELWPLGGGEPVAWSDGVSDREEISLAGLPPGQYLLGVYGFDGDVNPHYTLTVDASSELMGGALTKQHDSPLLAKDLGRLEGFERWGDDPDAPLTLRPSTDGDWFRIGLGEVPTVGHFARIFFDQTEADLKLELFRSGEVIAESSGTGGLEEVSLEGLNVGYYYLHVYSDDATVPADYVLEVNASGWDWSEGEASGSTNAFDLGEIAGTKTYSPLSIDAGDEDWFKFTLPADQIEGNFVRIDFRQALGDLDLALFTDPSGQPLRTANTSRDGERISLAGLAARGAGGSPIVYYLRVRGSELSAGGRARNASYSLSFQTRRALAADRYEPSSQSAPYNIPPMTNQWRIGDHFLNDRYEPLSIHSADEDWFQFSTLDDAAPAHFVSIAFNHFAGDLDLELWDENGPVRYSRTAGDVEIISMHGLPQSTYRARVFGHNGAVNPEYVLTINAPGHIYTDWLEGNNESFKPKDLRLIEGTRRFENLSINEAGDVDWFRFSVAADALPGNRIAIDYDPAYGHLDLDLYDVTGESLLGQGGGWTGHGELSLVGRVKQGQNYLVKVTARARAGVQPRYTLTFVAPQTDGDRTEAGAEYDLELVQGFVTIDDLSIHAPGDIDWFMFRMPQTAYAGHWVELAAEFQSGDLDLALYADPDDISPLRIPYGGSGSRDVERIDLAGLAGGTTYYLRVTGHRAAVSGSYSLRFNAPLPLAQRGDPWDALAGAAGNNSRATATRLQTVEGLMLADGLSIHAQGDEDWVAFQLANTASQGHSVAIDFDPTLGNLDIELRDANGNLLAGRASTSPSSGHEEISLAGLAATPAGNSSYYYLRIFSPVGTIPAYGLTFNAPVKPEPDRFDRDGRSNNAQAVATDLRDVYGVLTQASLSLDSAADVDWFRFNTVATAVAGHRVQIEFNSREGALDLTLVDAAGTVQRTSNTLQADYQEISLADLPAGTYFVQVSGPANPSYRLSIHAPRVATPDIAEGAHNNNEPERAYDLRSVPFVGARLCDPQSTPFGCQPTFIEGYFDRPQPSYRTSVGGPGSGPLGDLTGQDIDYASSQQPFLLVSSAGTDPMDTLAFVEEIRNCPEFFEPGGPEMCRRRATAITVANQQANIQQLAQQTQQLQQQNTALAILIACIWKGACGKADNVAGLPTSTLGHLSIDTPGDVDWFRFVLADDGLPEQDLRVLFNHGQGNLDIDLFAAAGDGESLGEWIESSTGRGGIEQISLARLRGGTYFLRVRGADSTITNPDYRLEFTLAPPIDVPQPDWAESGDAPSNDTAFTARDLRQLEGPRVFDGLSIHAPSDQDWFEFELPAGAGGEDFVGITFQHAQGDLDLQLYRGTMVAGQFTLDLVASSAGTTNLERIALPASTGATPERYFLRIYGHDGATNPRYSLLFSVKEVTILPDRLEGNNEPTLATNLNNLAGTAQVPGLTIEPGDVDWFRFTMADTGTAQNSVKVEYDDARGNIELRLYSASNLNSPLVYSPSGGRIDLKDRPPGEYYLRATGANGNVANRYTLTFDAPTTTSGAVADWTVMVYMTGGELARYAEVDINEMEAAAARLPGSVRFVVLYDPPSEIPAAGDQIGWTTTGVGVVRPDTNPDAIVTSFNTSWRGGEQNTGMQDTLRNFLVDAANLAPANNYALVLWNHGGGIRGTNFDRLDGHAGDTALSVGEIAGALATAQITNLKLVAFDACYMAMTEIAASLAPYTDLVVASQQVEGFGGFDYATAFDALAIPGDPAIAAALASSMVASYQRQYQDDPQGATTLSAIETDRMAAVNAALYSFRLSTLSVSFGPDWAALHAILDDARQATPSFHRETAFRDLGRFMSEVAARTQSRSQFQNVHNAASSVAAAVADAVVTKTDDRSGTTGMSIYLPAPGSDIDNVYTATNFGQFFGPTGWDLFLEQFVGTPGTAGTIAGDWSETGESAPRAFNLDVLVGGGHALPRLTLHDAADQDWFRFRTLAEGGGAHSVQVSFTGQAAVRLSLFDAASPDEPPLVAESSSGLLSLSLAGRPAAEYLVLVEGVQLPADGVEYGLSISAPSAPTSLASADWAGGNHSENKARSLGTIRNPAVWSGLRVTPGTDDWFSFDVPRTSGDEPCAAGAITLHLASDSAAVLRLYDAAQNAGVEVPLVEPSGRRAIRALYSTAAGKSYRFSVQSIDGALQGYSIEFDPAVAGACSRIAYSSFDEPPLGSANYFPTPGSSELGFTTTSEPTTGVGPLVGVVTTSTTPTSPVLAHRSVHAITTFSTVDLTNVNAATVSVSMQVRNTTYESGDYVRMYVTNGLDHLDLFQAQGSDAVDRLDELADDGYVTYTAAMPDSWTHATLILESASNSSAGAERFDFDNVEFRGIALPRLVGDLDGNGRVGLVDLALLQRNYGRGVPAAIITADLNGDGQVNRKDLSVFVANFGRTISLSPAISPSPIASPASPSALLATIEKAETRRKTSEREEQIDVRRAAPLRAVRHSRPTLHAVDAAIIDIGSTPADAIRGRRVRRRVVFE